MVPLTEPIAVSGLGLYAGLARSTAPAAEAFVRSRRGVVRALAPFAEGGESPELADTSAKAIRKARSFNEGRITFLATVCRFALARGGKPRARSQASA